MTQRGDSVFVHVLDWSDRALSIPSLGARVVTASMLATGASVPVSQTDDSVTLTLPSSTGDEPDRVIVLRSSQTPRSE
jgi:alpha-L-fucosidase